jgi:MFS transporter, OFA family, oxalate/formate antiporter
MITENSLHQNNMDDVKLFGLPAEQGRWFLIPLGIVVLLCQGAVYSWSILRTPLQATLKFGATDSLLPFATMLVVFSVLMPLTSNIIDRFAPRRVCLIGAFITALGYILSGFADNIFTLIFTYGIIAGLGVSLIYGVPLAIVAKWFPDEQALTVATTAIGFGLSPLITAPITSALAPVDGAEGWRNLLIIFGIVFSLMLVAMSFALKYPPEDWQPKGWNPPSNSWLIRTTRGIAPNTPIWETRVFWVLWLCFAIATFTGLTAMGIAWQVAEEMIKVNRANIAWNIALFAVFNCLGRPCFGAIAELFTPKRSAIACFGLLLIASLIMINAKAGTVFGYQFAFCLIMLSLGGWLAIAPAATQTLFHPDDYAKNYSIVFTAFGAGALLGAITAGRIRDLLGSYTHFFSVTAGLAVVGILLTIFLLKPRPKKRSAAIGML